MNNNQKRKSVRATAAKAITRVAYRGDSLQAIQLDVIPTIDENSRALAYEMIWGTTRYFHALENITNQLLSSPLAKKHHDIQSLLLLGLYQLIIMRIPEYAAVSETVNATDDLKKSWARKLINGCLRTFLRQKDAYIKEFNETSTLPSWLNQQLTFDWPEQKSFIEKAYNHETHLVLRVNHQRISRDDYVEKLNHQEINSIASKQASSALILEKNQSVMSLPGFDDGEVSIQSESAQLVAELITQLNQPSTEKNPLRILDACAAPGGKACHLLERFPDAILDCLEIDAQRIPRMQENFSRLKLKANIYEADASNPAAFTWLDNHELYDVAMIDAPCSGTGVISKHPDIKIHRSEEDVTQLAKQQRALLATCWPLVKKGGYLIYLTCSILKKENEQQVKHFISQHNDASVVEIGDEFGLACKQDSNFLGRQRLPHFFDTLEQQEDTHKNDNTPLDEQLHYHTAIFDGFYYCAIKKI